MATIFQGSYRKLLWSIKVQLDRTVPEFLSIGFVNRPVIILHM